VAIIVPAWNASKTWETFSQSLAENLKAAGIPSTSVLFIDSSSADNTAALVVSAGYRIHTIPQSEFDHGATRQLGVDLMEKSDILVFLTQDAVLEKSDSIARLLRAFEDPSIGACYGRQLPKPGATIIEAHARLFNYPARSVTRDLDSRKELGFKSIFLSDSFSAYRRSALKAVGGFPGGVLFGEDTILAARMHMAGWKTTYVSEAAVMHSHSYSMSQDFRRYFDIGCLHAMESWLLTEFGQASGEGKRFVLSELRYVAKRNVFLIPSVMLRTFIKLLGYKLGRGHTHFPMLLKEKLSMNPPYWSKHHRTS
jgi:rhamnosyltransferase